VQAITETLAGTAIVVLRVIIPDRMAERTRDKMSLE